MIIDPAISHLANNSFKNEPEMYQPAVSLLGGYLTMAPKGSLPQPGEFHPGCRVWDTHASKNLDGKSPDITITVTNTNSPDPTSAIAVWELKYGGLDNDGHGQVYDYLKTISKKQSQRSHFIGILSNLRENIVITMVRENLTGRFRCRTYKSMTLGYAISYLREVIRHNSEYHPPMPAFSIDLGIMESRLGNPSFCVVAAFPLPNNFYSKIFARGRWVCPQGTDIGDFIVVKRTVPESSWLPERPVATEINILQYIYNSGGHKNLPQLVYHSLDFDEFAITPYGYRLKPGDTVVPWRRVLQDVLEALKWLHAHEIIHRDVRWDNIIWDRDHAVLIDLGAAIHIADLRAPVQYQGGNICCPPALIGKFGSELYFPRPADDCYAFFLLMSMLHWPEQWAGLETNKVAESNSEVARELQRFWGQIEQSKVWGRYVRAAEEVDYTILEEFLDCCVYYKAIES